MRNAQGPLTPVGCSAKSLEFLWNERLNERKFGDMVLRRSIPFLPCLHTQRPSPLLCLSFSEIPFCFPLLFVSLSRRGVFALVD